MPKKTPKQTNYSRAPVIEAVIDVRVIPAKGLNFSKFEQIIQEKFSPGFPNISKQFQNEFSLKFGENPQTNSASSPAGYRFSSEDSKLILQIKEDGFIFSRLAPYENWEKFSQEARRLWMIYKKNILPEQIIRVAIRFINRFDFPEKKIELSDYFNVFPHVPGSYLMKNFSMQVMIDQEDINSTLVVTQAKIPNNRTETISILLDIDLFNEEKRSCEDEFWSFFDQLRLRKNEFFESLITDKTRELIS